MHAAVLRRISGGAAVVVGPGCLMYALVLSLRDRPQLRAIDKAHAEVLGTIAKRVAADVAPRLVRRGTSDWAIDNKKVSGNSVRCKREYLLYHGTLLYNFPLDLVGQMLAMPPREPDYRQHRPHEAFRSESADRCGRVAVRGCGRRGSADEPCPEWPQAETARLAAEKYGQAEWNEPL